MIVGTAGHIDHGKTTLVRALTGVDTDRLPQEKARGISIELGYAFLDVPGHAAAERIGFIDVPGHERLVHTMLAGATGIDFALLLVAADDGVMPQTREHLAVLSLLGIARGAVAITKVDRVDADRVDQVRAQVSTLLHGTPLATVPVLAVSSRTGEGLPALRDCLLGAAAHGSDDGVDSRSDDPGTAFRLAIDRAFTLDGVGTVVTGTVHAGRVQVGDELALTPSPAGLRGRVRSLHAQNSATAEARAGQRCAIGLVGVPKDAVTRGQWLVSPSAALSTDRVDAELTVWRDETRPLRSGTPVHVHVGAADVMGTVAVLHAPGVRPQAPGSPPPPSEGSSQSGKPLLAPGAVPDLLRPGQTGWVQIVLREPISVWRGDRIVLRDNSAGRAIAGATVLDPFAPARQRRSPQRLAELAAWALPERGARLAALLTAAPSGVALKRWSQAEGRLAAASPPLPSGTLHAARDDDADWALGAAPASAVADATLAAISAYHRQEPEAAGPEVARLRRQVAPRLAEPLWQAVLDDLRADGRIAQRGAFVQQPDHALRLSATDERVAQKIAPLLASAGFDGCWVRDLARDAREGEALMRTTLARLAQCGDLHQVVKDLCFSTATLVRLAAIVRDIAASDTDGAVSAGQFRDATGLGRKRAIQILEYFDRVGLLRRHGDVHRLRSDTRLFMTDSALQTRIPRAPESAA